MRARTLICTVAGLLAVGLLIASTPKITLAPKGLALPAEKVFSAISPDQVVIYNIAPQRHFLTLGKINIEQGFDQLTPQTKAMLFQKVKEAAASLGATGVVVNTLVPVNSLRQMIFFRGTAIYIPTHVRSKQ